MRVFTHTRQVHAVALVAMAATATTASAGGLAVREQSATFQGMSFAGAAAGGALSSSFWNSAAIAGAGPGLTSESSYSLIVPHASVTADPGTVGPPNGSSPTSPIGQSTDVGRMAALSASYGAYRLTNTVVAGVAINSPFGLGVEFDDPNWAGEIHGRKAKALTINVNPMLGINLMQNLAVGVGVQAQYIRINFKSNPSSGVPTQSSSGFQVDDYGFGATAGLLWSPMRGTDIGLGFRSAIHHHLEGNTFKDGDLLNVAAGFQSRVVPVGVQADVTLPEMVTLSLKQEINAATRLFGSVEWTNWSRLGRVDFKATSSGGPQAILGVFAGSPTNPGDTLARFDFNWHDGWLFALGGEYDWSKKLTLRGGVAYEISPIQSAHERFTLITDSNRTWASGGFSYKVTENTTVDFSYSHIFFADAPIDRPLSTSVTDTTHPFVGHADQSADIISMGMKTKW